MLIISGNRKIWNHICKFIKIIDVPFFDAWRMSQNVLTNHSRNVTVIPNPLYHNDLIQAQSTHLDILESATPFFWIQIWSTCIWWILIFYFNLLYRIENNKSAVNLRTFEWWKFFIWKQKVADLKISGHLWTGPKCIKLCVFPQSLQYNFYWELFQDFDTWLFNRGLTVYSPALDIVSLSHSTTLSVLSIALHDRELEGLSWTTYMVYQY